MADRILREPTVSVVNPRVQQIPTATLRMARMGTANPFHKRKKRATLTVKETRVANVESRWAVTISSEARASGPVTPA
jgi:hypothetical protein